MAGNPAGEKAGPAAASADQYGENKYVFDGTAGGQRP